jgi:hypothetical protein
MKKRRKSERAWLGARLLIGRGFVGSLGGRLAQRQATLREVMAAGSRFNFLRACRDYGKHFPCHKRPLSGNVDDRFRNHTDVTARLSLLPL